MPSPVTKAMIESYALMVMVMGTFFVYFCGMVWAFCNPKLSGSEDECDAVIYETCRERGEQSWCPPAPAYADTYINFWDDSDSLLTDCTAIYREDLGIINHTVATQDVYCFN